MTDLFKNFVLDVDDALGEGENIIHFVDDNYDIVTECNGKTLLVNSGNLNNYYQTYTLGRKTYAQTVVRTALAVTKIILRFFNIESF